MLAFQTFCPFCQVYTEHKLNSLDWLIKRQMNFCLILQFLEQGRYYMKKLQSRATNFGEYILTDSFCWLAVKWTADFMY